MKKSENKMALSFKRTINAPPSEVFDAWLNKKIPGTPWQEHDKLIFHPKVDGFFYWLIKGNAHYGRFTKLERGKRIQHTWMSRHTLGEESTVTLTFKKKGNETLMTLVHSDLPKDERAKAHEGGWNYFLDKLTDHLSKKSRRRK